MFWLKKSSRQSPMTAYRFDEKEQSLAVAFGNGVHVKHLNVSRGFLVGLAIAADKSAYYEAEIASRYRAYRDHDAEAGDRSCD